MSEITYNENNELCFRGEFHIGFLGPCIDDNVYVYFSDEFLDKIGAYGADGKPDLVKINQYVKEKQEQITANIELIENNFLKFLFNDYFGCGDPFWADFETNELCSFIIKEKMPKVEADECYTDFIYAQKVFTSESETIFYQDRNPLDEDDINDYNYVNNLNLNMKEYIKTYFPMINLDLFTESISEVTCGLSNKIISFTCSNPEHGYCAVCGAFAEIGEGFKFGEWQHR
jgi:hypothetical protein